MTRVDYTFFILPIFLASFGLATIFTAGSENTLFYKQLFLHTVGLFLAVGFIFIDLRFLRKGHYVFIIYCFSVALLILLAILGVTVNNAQSWFRFFGFSLQPVEIAKLSLILILSKFFYKRYIEIGHLPILFYSFVYAFIIFVLTISQPDWGSALVILGIWGFIVFVSGISKKYLLAIFILTIFSGFLAWTTFLQDFQKERIYTFLDPSRDLRGSGYNVYQSMISIGSGGLWGKGINFGSQSKLAFLPEYETDFIFAAFAEEWGFVGVFFCLLIYLILISKILQVTRRMESNFEILFCVGVAGYFIVHTGVNIGMNMGLVPVTGIPLPFMSSGGTHILIEWIMLGMLVSMLFNSRTNQSIAKELF